MMKYDEVHHDEFQEKLKLEKILWNIPDSICVWMIVK